MNEPLDNPLATGALAPPPTPLDNLPVGIFMLDADGNVVHANAAATAIWEQSAADAAISPGAPTGAFSAWPDARPVFPAGSAVARAIRAGNACTGEQTEIQTLRGQHKTILNYSVPERDARGQLTGTLLLNVDVTHLTQAEAELRALNETLEQRVAERTSLLRLMHDIASAANSARTLDEALSFALHRICDQFDCVFGQVLLPTEDGADQFVPGPVFHESQPGRFAAFRAATTAARLQRDNGLAWRVHAERRPLWTNDAPRELSPLQAAPAAQSGLRCALAFPVIVGTEVVAVLELFGEHPFNVDDRVLASLSSIGTQLGRIVERQRTERILRRTERLASMGTFAAGIAHEVNNPLSSILMTARYALKREQDRDALNGLLQEIIEDTERCARIVRDVLRFAKEEPGERVPLNVNELVQRVSTLARRLADQHGVRVDLLSADSLPIIQANPTQIEQAFVSVINNAVQASGKGQQVLVETAAIPGGVRVKVRDEGRGMTDRDREHAFDPFYTNRSREGGSGLGLSMAHGIVTDHGGKIDIDSQPAQGTTVTVELPVA